MSSTNSKIYNAAATVGKINMGFSAIISILISIGLLYWAYYNNKNWNYNIVDITGTIISINTPSNICNTYIKNNGNTKSTLYECPLTVEYTINNTPSSTVDVYTNSSTSYNVGQQIGLSYDTSYDAKPRLPEFRIQTIWIVGGAIFFLGSAYVNYLIAVSEATKPYLAAVGAADVAGRIF